MIQNIEISNFKSIRHLKMEGCRRINVLIGPPNVGKSNILEALGLFHYSNDVPLAPLPDLVRLKSASDLFHNWQRDSEAKISINDFYSLSVKYESDTQVLNSFYSYLDHDGNKTESSQLIRSVQSSFTSNEQKQVKSYETLVKLPIVSFYKFASHSSIDKKSRVQQLEVPFGPNLTEVIRLNATMRKQVGELFKQYATQLVFEQPNYDLRLWRFLNEENIISIPYLLVADTLKRLIFFQAAVLSNKDAVLLFEEPEAHCYPPYISKMLKEIIFDENCNQFFIVTHSPYVLNELMEHAQEETAFFLVNIDNESSTTVHQLNREEVHDAYQYGYDFFMNLEEFSKQKEVYG